MAKTAIIIGASRGLGLGLAKALSSRGWQVTATSRGEAPDLAAAIAASGGSITPATVDIDSDDSIAALDGALGSARFDLVFVNAGVMGPAHGSVAQVTPAEMGALLHTNAVAPIRVANRLRGRIADGGTLAFMSSILGSVGGNTGGGYDLYRASKAALNTLTRGFVATVLKDKPISVLTLHPGWVRTAMGGPTASLSVEESVAGLVEVIEANTAPGHLYLDYSGASIPW
ncbi:short-chain dehydrogenase [Polymorphobacter glacialis]|uniref:Short-chain dehydrogenase n=1 Tax=Sandarakinorhabdus glacialis TaxID=1614636 RepID=A0A917E8Z1_9SPHN|nr:SDR family oxidoreductase [Polymorphobacter glacialis]GGE15751.1 short-chain dehydrogenase [Polymorphobacter glacialis]